MPYCVKLNGEVVTATYVTEKKAIQHSRIIQSVCSHAVVEVCAADFSIAEPAANQLIVMLLERIKQMQDAGDEQ